MDETYKIVIVEDDRTTRLLLENTLGTSHSVQSFEAAEPLLECDDLAGAALYLLDVGLPGMNGLELCRQLKAHPMAAQVPVMFLSSHDSAEEILAGYEAGAQDYIVKPFDVAALRHKIENLQRIDTERRALAEQAQASEELTLQILASLDEYAVLVKFLRNLNECATHQDVIDAMHQTLQAFSLEGAVQTRMRGVEKTTSGHGENWPLEVAVMAHVRQQERIFEHKHLAAFNFAHMTVMVTNMPRQDPELCGRIRDHLAIAVESADAKLIALQAVADSSWMRGGMGEILRNIGQALEHLSAKYQEARYQEEVRTDDFTKEISTSFAETGMSEAQEDALMESVRQRLREFASLYDIAPQTEQTLRVLTARMQKILEQAGDNG